MVITDDRIETITDAAVAGRAMWASVRDGLAILLGGNLGEIAFTVGAGLLSRTETLNVRQLLLINLLTDVLPAIAVATRPPPDHTATSLLAEGPESSLGVALDRETSLRAAATAAAGMVTWLLSRPVSTPRQASTAALTALVGAQLGQTLAVRGRTPNVLVSAAASLAVLIAAVELPGLSHFFGNSPLLPQQWILALGCAGAATVAGWLAQQRSTSAGPSTRKDEDATESTTTQPDSG